MLMIALDTETGGLDSTEHSILSVGMWTVDTVECTVTNPLYFTIKEPEIVVVPEAMAINGLDLEHIESDGVSPEGACTIINNYCKEVGTKPTPLGHQVAFDMGFLQRLYRLGGGAPLPFHYRTIDVPSVLTTMYLARLLPRDISSSQKALEYFGMSRGAIHNALHDAKCTATVYLNLLAILGGDGYEKGDSR